MKILSICGLHSKEILSLFSQVKLHKNEDKNKVKLFNQNISDFHREMMKHNEYDSDGLSLMEDLVLGEMRIQQAAQILLSYAEAPLMVWADPCTTAMCGFWKKLEPQIKFLIFYQPPWVAINYLFEQFPEKFKKIPSLAAKLWENYNQNLLRFYNSNKKNCLLVNSYYLADNFAQLNLIMKNKFSIELEIKSGDRITYPTSSSIDRATLFFLNRHKPELLDLYMEIESQANLLGREADFAWQDELQKIPDEKDVLNQWYKKVQTYRNEKTLSFNFSAGKEMLAQKSQQNKSLKTEFQQIKSNLMADNNSLKQELVKIKNNEQHLSQLQGNFEAEIKQKEQELLELKKELVTKIQELDVYKQEEELNLLQFHQVQEELEHYFLLNQETQKLMGDYQLYTEKARQLILHFAQVLYNEKQENLSPEHSKLDKKLSDATKTNGSSTSLIREYEERLNKAALLLEEQQQALAEKDIEVRNLVSQL